jgi:site-specific DNA recombinase
MAKSQFFKPAFDALASNGYLGDPNGQLAYAYIRVSSDEQADEGHSGLPRQILHIHEIACEKKLKIAWDMVFADDYTGFEFERRPELSRLRREYKSGNHRAQAVVMEHLDRLSRNADWHQGFLLDEMRRNGLEPVFWKAFSSRVERAVMGAIAQDAMELSLMRMKEGRREKARTGRVTARTLAYGYKFVDSNGNEGLSSRRDTHYAIYEPEAQVVRKIFNDVASGKTLGQVAAGLTGIYPTPTGQRIWGRASIRAILKRPTYKGEFHSMRWSKDKDGRPIENEDFIVVPVPAIVSREIWDEANRILEKNKQTAARNAKRPYLLTGLMKCASCGRSFMGHNGRTRLNGKRLPTPQRVYHCTTRTDHKRELIGCPQGYIGCVKLDNAVWDIVCQVLLEPQVLIETMDRHFAADDNVTLLEQIAFLETQIGDKAKEEDKLYRAYLAGAFDEHEFAEKRRILKETSQILLSEIENLRSRVLTQEQVAARKQFIMDMATQLKKAGQLKKVPFEVKRQIIKLVVDQITVDTREQWIRVEGAISETYALVSIAGSNKSEIVPLASEEITADPDPIVTMNNRIQPQALFSGGHSLCIRSAAGQYPLYQ